MGAYFGDDSPYTYLRRVAEEMVAAPPTELFPERYKEHVACALEIVANFEFTKPPAAIAAAYLATRFELFFRLLSGKLKGDGTWLNKAADRQIARAKLGKRGLTGNRVSDVAVTYRIMKLDLTHPAIQVFDKLDKAILPKPIIAVGNFTVADIGDRIAFGRHRVGHGEWGDMSSEAVFYGLVTAIIFYNQT
jgi:hypothetical protein